MRKSDCVTQELRLMHHLAFCHRGRNATGPQQPPRKRGSMHVEHVHTRRNPDNQISIFMEQTYTYTMHSYRSPSSWKPNRQSQGVWPAIVSVSKDRGSPSGKGMGDSVRSGSVVLWQNQLQFRVFISILYISFDCNRFLKCQIWLS